MNEVTEEVKGVWASIKDFLEFKIIEIDDYSFSFYNLFILILIFLVVRLIVVSLERILKRKVAGKKWITEGKQHAIVQIVRYVVYLIAFLFAFRSIGLDITPVIIGSSALFVGLGFGLQEAFRDFVSGIILLFEGDVVIGDVIEFENGMVATVKRIKLRTSKVRTRDGIVMLVPNSQLINDRVINWSNSNILTRFHVEVGVAYGSDVELVKKVLMDAAESEEQISVRIKPFVRFADFGSSSLDFELYFWSEEVWKIENVKSSLRFKIDKKFRENQVTIPFPQRDLHFKSTNFSLNKNDE